MRQATKIDENIFAIDNYLKLNDSERNINNDLLASVLKTKPNDSLTRALYLKVASRYYSANKSAKYFAISKKALKLSQEANDSLNIAKNYQAIGNYYYDRFRNDSCFYYYTRAEKTYKKIKSNVSIDDLLISKANILFFEKDFAGAEAAAVAVLSSATKSGNKQNVYNCYITIGISLSGMKNYSVAQDYYNKALNMVGSLETEFNLPTLRAQPINYIGTDYQTQNQHQLAISYFEKALKLDNFKNFNPEIYASLINNIGYSKFKLGDNGAIKMLNEALAIRTALKTIPDVVSSKINLAEYYLSKKDTAQAFRFINEAKIASHGKKMFEDELRTLALLMKIDPKKVNYYNNRFVKLSDSLQINERATRNKFARIEFETDEIIIEKNKIEEDKKRVEYQKKLITGIGSFLLLFSGLGFYSYRQHARNKQLKLEQEKIAQQKKANEMVYDLMLQQQQKIDASKKNEKSRISMELHDGILGKLGSIRMNLWVLNIKTDPVTIKDALLEIDRIQAVELEIRKISHDLRIDIFEGNDNFVPIIKELFDNQQKDYGTAVDLYIEDKIIWQNISSQAKMNVYRIFQESLQNINKYAKAQNILAFIKQKEKNIHVEISDDGIGFDPTLTRKGIGLMNIEERMQSINGTLKIESSIGNGANIILDFPI